MEGVRVLCVGADLLDASAVSGDDTLIIIKSFTTHGTDDQEVRAAAPCLVVSYQDHRAGYTLEKVQFFRSELYPAQTTEVQNDLWGVNDVRE